MLLAKNCLGFAHSVEANWRLGGSEAWRLGVGSSWEIDGKASWRLPGGSWEEGNVKFMCKSFQNPSSKLLFCSRELPGGSWEEGNVKFMCKAF